MQDFAVLLTDAAKAGGVTELKVAIDACKKSNLQGMDMMLVMAAAVELIEPST